MNNKELTELKERFMSAYCEPNKWHHKWGDKLVDGEYYQYSPDDVWAWIELTVLPHLKSNDEIKREAELKIIADIRLGIQSNAIRHPQSADVLNAVISALDDVTASLTQKENNE